MAGTRAPRNMPSLTGARFVAAGFVVCSHVLGPLTGPLAGPGRVFRDANEAVTFFFVLSGAVLVLAWRDDDRVVPFWRRRVARIVPLYLLVGLANLAWLTWQGEHVPALDVVTYFTMTQAWSREHVFAIVNPAWSVSCEAFFYLVFPLLRRAPGLMASAATRAAMAAGLVGLHLVVQRMHLSLFSPPVRLIDFMLGMVVGAELASGTRLRIPVPAALAGVVVTYVVLLRTGFDGLGGGARTLCLVAMAAAVLSLAGADLRGRSTVMVPLAGAGLVSYALYMSHGLVIRVVSATAGHIGWFDGTLLQGAILAFATLAIAMAVATCLYLWFERPAEARLRGTRPRIEEREILGRGQLGPSRADGA